MRHLELFFFRLIFWTVATTTWEVASAFVLDVQQQKHHHPSPMIGTATTGSSITAKTFHHGSSVISATTLLYNSYLDSLTTTIADTTRTRTTSQPGGRVQDLQSVPEFLELLDQAPQDSLVVIKYYGKSCPLCKRIEMKYKKMARTYAASADATPIQFAEIHNRIHPDLFPTLGIETFPYIHIYRNGLCVASHGTDNDVTFEPMVKDTIERELAMSQEQWDSFLTAFAGPIRQATQRVEHLRQWFQPSQEEKYSDGTKDSL